MDLSNLQPSSIAGDRPNHLQNLGRQGRAREDVIHARSVLGTRSAFSPPQDDRVGGSPLSTSAAISAEFLSSPRLEPNGLHLSSFVRSRLRQKIAKSEKANVVRLQAELEEAEREEVGRDRQQVAKTVAEDALITRDNKPDGIRQSAKWNPCSTYSGAMRRNPPFFYPSTEQLVAGGSAGDNNPPDPANGASSTRPFNLFNEPEKDAQKEKPNTWEESRGGRKTLGQGVPNDVWVCCVEGCKGPNIIALAPEKSSNCGHTWGRCCSGPGQEYLPGTTYWSTTSEVSHTGLSQSERPQCTPLEQVDGETPTPLYMCYTISKDATIGNETYKREKLLASKSRPHILPPRSHNLPRGPTTFFNAPRPPSWTHTESLQSD